MADAMTCVVIENGANSTVRIQHGTILCEATATPVQLAVACGEPCMFTRIFGTDIAPDQRVQTLLASALLTGGVVCTAAQAIANPTRGRPVRLSSGTIVVQEFTPRENIRIIVPGQAAALFQIGLLDLGVAAPGGGHMGKFAVFGDPTDGRVAERLAATIGVADTAELQKIVKALWKK